MSVLPDVLESNLDIVFCGTAAGTASAKRKAYYAGRGNLFWPTLHRVGLTPILIAPEQYQAVTKWKLGLTDLAKHTFGADSTLRKTDYSTDALQSLIAEYQPKIVAFTSKKAAQVFLGPSVEFGLQPQLHGKTRFFVLPSPSGLARRSWCEDHWRELAKARTNL